MLVIDPTVDTALRSYTLTPHVTVAIMWSATVGGPVYLTDAPSDITVDSITYNADGGLLTVSPPSTQGDVDRDIFNIALADTTHEYRTRLLSESTGINVTVNIGFNMPDGTPVTGTVPVYRGVISGVKHEVMNGQEPISAIECTGPLTKLTQATHRSTTEDSQKFYHPADTCFDRSFDTENKVTLQWGGLGGEG